MREGPYHNRLLGIVLQWLSVLLVLIGFTFFFGVIVNFQRHPPTYAGPLYIGIFAVAFVCSYYGKALKKLPVSPHAVMASEKKLVFFLHAFHEKGNYGIHHMAENSIIQCFDGELQFVCLGDPNENVTEGSIQRMYFSRHGDEWRAAVVQLIDRASLIVVCFNASEGVSWEVRRLLEKNRMRDTVFYFPKIRYKYSYHHYAELAQLVASSSIVRLPALGKKDFKMAVVIGFSVPDAAVLLKPRGKYYNRVNNLGFRLTRMDPLLVLYGSIEPYVSALGCKPGKMVRSRYRALMAFRIGGFIILLAVLLRIVIS